MRIEGVGPAALINADCREAMRLMDENSIDAIVTDPPYGLGFMGKGWDHGVPGEEFWREALRVAKPGAHLLAFGGTRTFHHLMVAIEDAGWEIRDTIMWVYGSGFPKSKNLDGEREGWGTALKPAFEPIIVARKPLIGTVAANVQTWGTGAINIDGCRVGTTKNVPASVSRKATPVNCYGQYTEYGETQGVGGHDPNLGRWPANLIHDGSDEVLALFPDSNGSGGSLPQVKITGYGDGAVGTGKSEYFGGPRTKVDAGSGSAARFFKECGHDELDLLFCRAEAILESWNLNFANTAGESLPLPKSYVASVLNDVVILASRGGRALNTMTGLSTVATPIELRRLSESLITAMLSAERKPLPDQSLGVLIPNGCRVNSAETSGPIGITTITISHWKSDGSADAVTFSITLLNLVAGEKGSASRFKYCAKTSKKDRNEGLDDPGPQFKHGDTLRKIENKAGAGNHHPTVKPTELMRYLCRLVTPPGGMVLDPFMGSGSTGKAAMKEGFNFVGIDNDTEHGYFDIAIARVRSAILSE